MNTLYLDIFSGISGDMFLGALLDLGVDPRRLEEDLAHLGLEGYQLEISRQQRGAIAGTKFDVRLQAEPAPPPDRVRPSRPGHEPTPHAGHGHGHEHGHGHGHEHGHGHGHGHGHEHGPEQGHGRTFLEIKQLIEASPLSAWVKEKAVAVFRRVALAEGKVHGRAPEQVHFHEVGAIDSIVDITGACLALEALGKPRVLAGPVWEGTGSVRCAHGQFPLPAPATLEILAARGMGIRQCEEPHELVTPTGAALLAEFAESFGPMAGLAVVRIGYGLGSRENLTRPNVLRALWCEGGPAATAHDWETDTVAVLEANLDDLNPEILGALVPQALAAGAWDVFYTPIQMKKSRPGILVTLLCPATEAERFAEWLLRETSSFGVRLHLCERRKLRRDTFTVHTLYGNVTVKVGRLDGRVVEVSPEFESCRELAEKAGVPIKIVYAAARQAVEFP